MATFSQLERRLIGQRTSQPDQASQAHDQTHLLVVRARRGQALDQPQCQRAPLCVRQLPQRVMRQSFRISQP